MKKMRKKGDFISRYNILNRHEIKYVFYNSFQQLSLHLIT
jgi:hypothetical protein